MNMYDCVVVGAGPSGCQCARKLAELGWKILLIEKVADFSKNNFSSAGTIIDVMNDYNLPMSVVGTTWNRIKLIGNEKDRTWNSKKDVGVVFDFQKLRKFLSDDAQRTGACDILFGYTFKDLIQKESYTELVFQPANGKTYIVGTKVIVDATGSARSVMYHHSVKPSTIADTGIEYLIKVKQKHTIDSATLQFFLSSRWQPHGYAWIFPMGGNIFKIGTALYDSPHQKGLQPLKFYVDKIIQEYLELSSYEIIEIHGSTLHVTFNHEERFYHDNIIGIGDAISSVNALGGEGIRHGMHSANFAAECIDLYLKGSITNFSKYEERMRRYFGLKWRLSNIYSYLFYQKFNDWFIDVIISALGYLKIQELIDVLFYYRFILVLKTVYRKFILRRKYAVGAG